ncbi:hypothetical protein ACFQ0K_08725 [Nocardioides caeni]|uniref:Uncharacterized protein n=1 Tax=Nocardioides caeni TaxID=574700 RepID=A0A4S8N398_9ACTN|nr:hypothetical protein [Nocardioides caeni]THV10480.1 hypothetical protein E9934_14220 [Nocardioides caeni]
MDAQEQHAAETQETAQGRPGTDEDVQSDPHLDDPRDQRDEDGDEQTDEGASSDWSSEGGATPDGPATAESAAHEAGG